MSTTGKPSGIDKAISLHQSGQLDKADKAYARLLKNRPRHTDALHMRGVLKLQQGLHQQAEHLLKIASAIDQADPWIRFHLGEVLAATNRHELAAKQFLLAIEKGASDADVHFMYANTLFELGEFQSAIDHYQASLKFAPNDPDCRLNLANALEANDQLFQAIEILEPLANLIDAPVALKLQLAELLTNEGRALKAHTNLLTIQTITLGEVDQTLATAKLMLQRVRHESADYLLNLVLPHFSELNSSQYDISIGLLNDLGRHVEALEKLEQLTTRIERSAWSWFQQGIGLQVSGEFGQAAQCHQRALSIDETLGFAAYSLASNDSVVVDEQSLKRWTNLIDNTSAETVIDEERQAQFAFAIARTLDKNHDVERAFERYLQANALVAKSHRFDCDKWDFYIDQLIDTFDFEYFKKYNDENTFLSSSDQRAGQNLTFIVGMPRSGSTLLERILVTQTSISGLGEHHAMRRIVADIPEVSCSNRAMPECALELSAKDIQTFREYYLSTLPNDDGGGLYVDKMLGNFLRLGVLAPMFPKSHILHSCRDPMATSVSCFINTFRNGLKFTYDLYGMGRAWQAYQRLMQHWHEVLPMKIMDVQYETLVSEPDAYQQKIFQFLEIPDSKLTHESQAASGSNEIINTASYWQARQPISTGSIKAWTRFDAYLDPLREGLAYTRQ